MELEEAIHLAVQTLKEGFEGQMDEHNIEVRAALFEKNKQQGLKF